MTMTIVKIPLLLVSVCAVVVLQSVSVTVHAFTVAPSVSTSSTSLGGPPSRQESESVVTRPYGAAAGANVQW
jgi:hypothetical protein